MPKPPPHGRKPRKFSTPHRMDDAAADRPPPRRRPTGDERRPYERRPAREGSFRPGFRDRAPHRQDHETFSVIFEDEDLIVVDKPVGMVTADPTRTVEGTLFDLLKSRARSGKRGRKPRANDGPPAPPVRVVHRLDKEASGLLVFAKSERAFVSLKDAFRSRRIQRQYVAVAEGDIGPAGHSGTHQSFLMEDDWGVVTSLPMSSFRGAPGRNAKLAVTHFRVIGSTKERTLVQVRIDTGRKHQIRIHFLDMKHPLIGDRRYSARTNPIGRLALHAAELKFAHPGTGQEMRFSSPAPASFYRCIGLEPPAASPPTPSSAAPSSPPPRSTRDTSWQGVADWYDDHLGQGDEGVSDHYEQIILPGTLRLLEPSSGQCMLDVACGQGVLSRRLAALGVHVVGVDLAPSLIEAARRRAANDPLQEFVVGDARSIAATSRGPFDAAACVMALTNIDPMQPVWQGICEALKPGGRAIVVISHPAFRIPRQTSWGWDGEQKTQYRRVDGYLSPSQTPIAMHPGSDPSVVTWTFHRPLQAYIAAAASAGLVIDAIEEWPGQRTSEPGPRAAEENRIRREIPLFLAVRATRPLTNP